MRLNTPRKTLLLTFFITMLVFSTACIRADMAVSVQDDGTGTITLVEAIDVKAFQDAMKQFGGALGGGTAPSSPADIFNEKDIDKTKLPAGSKVEAYKDGNFQGVKITTPFSKPEDILPTLNKVADSISGLGDLASLGGTTSRPTGGTARPGPSPTPQRSSSSNSPSDAFDKFSLAKTSDGWKFEATAKAVGGSTSGLGGGDAMTQAMLGAILKDASVTFSLRLPGKVTQTNADSNNNGELKWNLPLTSTQAKTLSATSVGSGTSSGGGDGGGFPIVIVIGVIVAIAVIGGLYYMSKQRQAQPPAPPPPPVPGTSV